MFKVLVLLTLTFMVSAVSHAGTPTDEESIRRAVLDYIESQHKVQPGLAKRGLDRDLAKRTYWLDDKGKEFILETDYEDMLELAAAYNKDGDRFPEEPKVEIEIFDIDQRTASVKLTVDEWIDYMHLYKTRAGDWKIINVLWQFHDTSRQKS
ncbi:MULTISPECIES: nuclear transport factor 2 family protein [Microbulbifer]|uniref:nuclear transport factor 2 family protein n=1 Tax=Microbulbifer TaxID=48073 RepID=UPI001E3AD57F|nr:MULTISPECIES: nuclear transport factor 2 family protein [Microbulbifer]UHQ55030.1 nuclear transport factor 2 family protein [Microbulbifer sp. YPW16]